MTCSTQFNLWRYFTSCVCLIRKFVAENWKALSGGSQNDAGRQVYRKRGKYLQNHHKVHHRNAGEWFQQRQHHNYVKITVYMKDTNAIFCRKSIYEGGAQRNRQETAENVNFLRESDPCTESDFHNRLISFSCKDLCEWIDYTLNVTCKVRN